MTAKRIDGKSLATEHLTQIKSEIPFTGSRPPGLCVIQVGDNPASSAYIRGKESASKTAGILFEHLRLPRFSDYAAIKAQILVQAQKHSVDGIILQLPLDLENPLSASQVQELLEGIPPAKDADGLHPHNLGRVLGAESLPNHWTSPIPATPLGMMRMLEKINFPLVCAKAVVIGKSRIVGMPIAMLLSHSGATVTLCHSKTKNLSEHTLTADLVVVAAGKKHLLTAAHLKPGVTVLDVGIHALGEGKKLTGDAHPDCESVAAFISPVPGGVGPMTVAGLIENTLRLYQGNIASR